MARSVPRRHATSTPACARNCRTAARWTLTAPIATSAQLTPAMWALVLARTTRFQAAASKTPIAAIATRAPSTRALTQRVVIQLSQVAAAAQTQATAEAWMQAATAPRVGMRVPAAEAVPRVAAPTRPVAARPRAAQVAAAPAAMRARAPGPARMEMAMSVTMGRHPATRVWC